MASLSVDFGTLRSLSHSPGRSNWKRLSGMLDRFAVHWGERQLQEQILPYLRAQLSRWPRQLYRYAQHNWLHDVMHGRDVPQLEFATALHLVGHTIEPARVERLMRSPHLRSMRCIDLSHKKIGDMAALAIVEGARLQELLSLNLRGTRLSEEAMELILLSPALAGLQELDLSSCGAVCLEWLPQSAFAESLEVLTIEHNRLGDPEHSLEMLCFGQLTNLRMLDLRNNRISAQARDRLQCDHTLETIEILF